jgi:AraC-like DNA-binding protein
MNDRFLEQRKIDPSEKKQIITDINIRVHCCRYWLLEEWECRNMAFPFWRIYYNTTGNAKVAYHDNIQILTVEKIVVIPPNTPFAASLTGNFHNQLKESIVGKRIQDMAEVEEANTLNKADHLFIHFNLGLIADIVKPGIYAFTISHELKKQIFKIITSVTKNDSQIDLETIIAIHSVIANLISIMDIELWGNQSIDSRVLAAMNFIEKNLTQKLDNAFLASQANMAKNSFSRLFHANVQLSLQEYIRKRRIEFACNLMHHSNDSIEMIAMKSGFFDRHHFSKVFKGMMNVTPAYYKEKHTINS